MKIVARPRVALRSWSSAHLGRAAILFCAALFASAALPAQTSSLSGVVTDPRGKVIANARIKLARPAESFVRQTRSDREGRFTFSLVDPGAWRLIAEAPGFSPATKTVTLAAGQTATVELQFSEVEGPKQVVTVVADVKQIDVFHPDPSQRVFVRQETLDANPGRPGVPVSIPGLPAETASGGIKAPQYFVPGVAGDHGEPIAQFFQVGGLLFPNNLPANAHGNGYADPNLLVPAAIESVQVDAGAFNVREGNNAVNMAATYGIRQRLEPLVQLTGDRRDIDLVAGWSPQNPETRGWTAIETSFGNGFLNRPEHRKQYKINSYRVFTPGRHEVTLFGVGYYGVSKIPGLAPIDVRVPEDTIDPRQSEQTHTGLLAASDTWRLTDAQQFQFSGFFRTYNLSLLSDFGDGLIRQSEFRTVAGGGAAYAHKFSRSLSLLAGLDVRRDAPRRLNLDRADAAGLFQPVTGNDLTLTFASPFAAVDGSLVRYVHYSLGVRRDEVGFNNLDRLRPSHSFDAHTGVTSPKATVALLPPEARYLPSIALSYGQAFHTNDPRIGTGTDRGTVLSRSRAYQLVVSKNIRQTDFRVTLARVANAQQLARVDPDTGLQEDVGPSVVRSITVAARRYFTYGSLQASFARANATDRITGEPVPEAPRLIWDVLGTTDRLPLRLHARGEFEYVGRKPLGDGFTGVPVREIRGAVVRSLGSERMDLGVNFLIAGGYTGQTLETLALAGEDVPFERIVGVRLQSYVTLSWTYHFRRPHSPP